MSRAPIVVLPNRFASSVTVSYVAWLVGRPRTISTSFISGTGFMKCMPITRSGRPLAAAIFVIEIEDVFDARIASSLQTSPSDLKIWSFSSSFSGAASMTTSHSKRS
jgi:hypothetical protein